MQAPAAVKAVNTVDLHHALNLTQVDKVVAELQSKSAEE